MKYSGVEWIGNIPNDWKLVRFKDVYISTKEIAGSNSINYERLALTLNGVIKRPKNDSEGLQPKEFDTYQILRENDFVFKMIDLQNVSTSRVGLSPYDGLVSPAYLRFSPKSTIQCHKYLYYYFMSMYYNCVFNSLGGDGVRSALNSSDMGSLYCPYPNADIQKKVVSVLDTKLSQIDELISIEEKQIEKLKEYKQSSISNISSKGLSPLTKEYKKTSNLWFSNIPSNWTVQKILSQLQMPITDGPHTTPELIPSGIAFVSAEAISCGQGTIDFNHIRGYISNEFYDECCLKYIPKIDDIYMIKSGATTGRVGIVTTLEPKFTIWSPLAAIRVDSRKMIAKYLFYLLQSDEVQKQVQLSWSFGTQQNLGMRNLEQIKIVVPPLEEQIEIASYLDEKCNEIDSLINIKQSKIEKLNEYKKSLIYEYVTGKKEVQANA